MRQLIARGAEVHAATGDGATAYGFAQAHHHREAAALLRRHGA